jgi:hypothetical protein
VDLIRARVALRERPLIDVVDLSVRFCVANAGPYAKLSFAAIAPAFAVSWTAAKLGGWALGWLVALALAGVVEAPFVVLASRLVFSGEARLRDAARVAAQAVPRLLVARLAQGIAFLVSLLLAGLPWLWLGPLFLFVPEVVLLERSSLGASWGRVPRLAHAQLGVATATVLLFAALTAGGVFLADAAGREVLEGLLQIRPPPPLTRDGGSILALLGFWAVLPIRATTRFFVYLDVRTRTEGWDIQTRFAALAARDAADTSASVPAPAPVKAAS